VKSYPEGWHLVEAGVWQVSVAPDGLLMLPRHLHPREAADFAAAIVAAADVGHEVIKANAAKTSPQPAVEALSGSTFVTPSADPTPGVKMLIQQRGPAHQSAIGRTKGQPRRDPRQPESVQAQQLIAGPKARRGRSS